MFLGSQKHFYMEPQVSIATIEEGGVMKLDMSSQFPTFTQQQVARVLGIRNNQVTVQVRRVGGGFGGKLTRCVVNAAAAAVSSYKHKCVVRVLNNRTNDFRLVGGREPMKGEYKVGFDDDGYIKAMDLLLHVDCGYAVGDSAGSAEMAVQWSDSAYRIPSFRSRALLYLTNTQTCTSHRAPGVPQAMVLMEAAIDHIASFLDLPRHWVQERNLYKEGDKTPYGQILSEVRMHDVWDRLNVSAYFQQRQQDIAIFNANNKWKKKGIAMTPTKYGMAYSGRRDGAVVEIFAADGSVIVSHSGCEIGQGIHTKVAQTCAYKLGIPLSLINLRPTSTDKTPNGEATGGSSTSESVVRAVMHCCDEILRLLKPIKDANPGKLWEEVVQEAHDAGVRLFACSQPFSKLDGNDLFDYFVYASACAEVEVDILTGEINILNAELVYDCGISMNPALDIGQIEGAFVMGIGLYLEEEVVYSRASGDLLTCGTWEYKPPCSHDVPEKFKVTLLDNDKAKHGVLGSKATGEPPYALASSVYFAVKDAIRDSRRERGLPTIFNLQVPATVAVRQVAAAISATRDFEL